MNNKKSILTAFILNLFFAVFELIGGLVSKSVAIMSDALHDAGDAISIGISYFLEKKSEKKANEFYTYGYLRYSVLGAIITTLILIIGSIIVIISSIKRLFYPVMVHYNGMLILAIVGFVVNFIAAYITRDGDSLNKKAVNLHMLEDVLGWLVVLVGSIIIKFTKIYSIDAIMSIGVALFLLYHAWHNLKKSLLLFLEATPEGIDVKKVETKLKKVDGVKSVHHIHLWSMDGEEVFATMHIVCNLKDYKKVKEEVKKTLESLGISHSTIELDTDKDECKDLECEIKNSHH